MSAVQQSGNITPGHLASWVSPGVIRDAGPAASAQKVIASLRGANFNTIFDQPIALPFNLVAFQLTNITVTNSSTSLTSAQGGFYPQPNKAGSPLVAAGQAYSALTGPTSLLPLTLTTAGQTTRFSATTLGSIGGFLQIWFSLTVAQGAMATADIYIMGIDLT